VKLAELSNLFSMQEYGILGGVKTYSDPSCIFSEGQDPPGSRHLPRVLGVDAPPVAWVFRYCGLTL